MFSANEGPREKSSSPFSITTLTVLMGRDSKTRIAEIIWRGQAIRVVVIQF